MAFRALMAGQLGIWYAQQLDPANTIFNAGEYVEIPGALDVEFFVAALRRTVDEAQAVHARFVVDDGVVRQDLSRRTDWSLHRVDLSGVADPRAEAEAWMWADMRRPVDLGSEPLFTHALFTVAPGSYLWYSRCHHIALDGFSSPILLARTVAVYNALREGRSPEAETLVPVEALIEGEAAYRESPAFAADRDYWMAKSAGGAEPVSLSDLPPRGKPRWFRRHLERVSGEEAGELRIAARGMRTSLSGLMITATAVYLHLLKGAGEVVLGVPVLGRASSAERGIPAMMANILPVRIPVRADQPVAELVRVVSGAVREALRHQRYRYEDIGRDLRLVNGGRLFGPSINVMSFDFGVRFGDIPVVPHNLSNGPVDDLTISVYDRAADGSLEVTFDANPELYTEDENRGHARRFQSLLRSLARPSAKETPVSDLELFGPGEKHRVLVEWNDTATVAADVTLPELFERQVRRTPGAVAVSQGDTDLTYAMVNDRADRLARFLIARGAGPEHPVAVLMERTPALVVALLAVLKAGAPYVALDPSHPKARIDSTLRQAGVATVLTDDEPASQGADDERAPQGADDEPAPEGADDEPASESPVNGEPRRALRPGDPAYISFTSGSTGRPKGVVVTQRSLVNLLLATRKFLPLDAGDRLLAVTTVAFDIAHLELWAPLISGARVVLADAETVRDPRRLAGLLTSSGTTVLQATPSAWQALVATAPEALSGVRKLVGGEALPPAVAAALHGLGGEVLNLYGPTETTIWSTVAPVTAETVGAPPIGRPIDNTSAYVLDAALRPVPPGVVGELYLGGTGLARGYHRESALTASRFVADPFGPPGARLYRTGDTVRWDSGGTLHFIGRGDDQIKLRGFRIEPAEVENALLRHPRVRQAVVAAREHPAGGKVLVAYVVTEGEKPDDLLAYAGTCLPHYMVPAAVVFLDELPQTPNRKVDRKALPAPRFTTHVTRAPRTPQEHTVCALYAEVLGIPQAGVDDDFFALGGHSLLATRLANRVQAVLGAEVGIRALFEHPTPARLAAHLRGSGRSGPGPAAADRSARIPLSAAQQRLWFVGELEGPSAAQHIPLAVRLTGPLDEAALRDALRDVVDRHEALRTVFPVTAGKPEQRVLDADVTLAVVPFTAAAVPAEADRPFDLATEPPLRATLFVVERRHHILLIVLHHIAGDGWSLRILADELSAAYKARLAQQSPEWTPLPIQYADYALWQRGLDSTGQLTYWREALNGQPDRLELPFDRPRTASALRRGDTVPFALGADGHRRLQAIARDHRVSLFMVLQAGLAVLLGRLAGTHDVAIGTPVAGRTDVALEPLIGFFANTLVLRTDLSGNPAMGELLARVRVADLAAYAHQDVPFERLVEELAPERSLSRHPLFQVMLVVENESPRLTLPGLDVEELSVDARPARFDLTLSLAEKPDGGGLTGAFHYATDLFDRATVEGFAAMLGRILAFEPETRVHDLEMLDPAQRHRLLVEYNRTAPTTMTGTVPELFERQVRKTPQAVAVVGASEELSYAELNAWSNRLARMLVERGAGPERIVALTVPRSAAMIVALLAIAKTGAAYLPIDSRYPAGRTAQMIDQARPVYTVTASMVAEAVAASTADANLSDADRLAPLRPAHPAYVIFTSGSTGRPKAVVVTHAGLPSLVETQIDRLAVGPDSRVLQSASLSFDAASGEVFRALLSGAALVVSPMDADGPARVIREQRVTHSLVPPALLATLPGDALDGLRTLTVGGEASPPALARPWAQGRLMLNGYGPSETTIAATYHRVRPEDADRMLSSLPIGTPVRDTRLYVLDTHLGLVPVGVAGELYIAGPGLARGYLDQSGLTAERFVACPFGPAGQRMYRTGDLVRWDSGGELEFLRRIDDQVQLRGVRIEPAEIEAVLMRHPAVRRAAVVVREDRPGDQRLVAYVVGGPGEDSVREFAARELPEAMVPGEVVVLDQLPLTANGKVDRQALPAPAAVPTSSRAPRTVREEVLCGLFAEVLGLDRVGVDDSFFALGGHSLTATRLVSRIREALRTSLSVRTLFENPRVADLAPRLGETPVGDALQVVLPLNAPPSGSRPLFCVHPAGGLAWVYARLRHHLPDDQPLYGLQARGLVGDESSPATVDEIAGDYAAQIRRVQPQGPYRLLGWSFGGIIAQAVAVRLQQLGAEVDLLMLIDTHPRVRHDDERALMAELAETLGVPAGTTVEELRPHLLQLDHPLADLPDSAFAAMYEDCRLARTARLTYVPGVFRGDVLTFTATVDAPDPVHSWAPFVDGDVVDHPVPCRHGEILGPDPLSAITDVLRKELA